MRLWRKLDVWSVDTNMSNLMAQRGQFWSRYAPGAANVHWPTLREAGGWYGDANYEAFRRSCVNVMQAWRELAQQQREGLPTERQLAMFDAQEVG